MTKPPEQQTPSSRHPTPAEEAKDDLRWWEKSRRLAWLEGETLEGFEAAASTTPFLEARCRTDIPPSPEQARER